MQDPATDIKEVVRLLLSGTISERQKVIDTCFTSDAKFIHPLLTLRGRREIFDLYQYWHDLNLKISFFLPKIVVSQHKDRLVIDFDEFVTPLLAPCATVTLRLIVFLDLQKTPSGYKISCQEDHILWAESLRKNFPTFNSFYETYVNRATGLAIVYTMRVIGKVVRYAQHHVLPHVPVVNQNPRLRAKFKEINEVLDGKTLHKWDAQGPHQLFEQMRS